MAINLLPKQAIEDSKVTQLKRMVRMITTVALVIYIVVVAAVTGWWLFLAQADRALQAKADQLTGQIASQSETEGAMVWTANRIQLISDFLAATQSAALQAENVSAPEVAIINWLSDPASDKVTVSAGDPGTIEAYALALRDKYPTIMINSMQLVEGVWSADILLSL